jgi:hypothetical protein
MVASTGLNLIMSDEHKVVRLIQDSQRMGFKIRKCKNGLQLIHKNKNVHIHTIHKGKRALHPLIRFLDKTSAILQ